MTDNPHQACPFEDCGSSDAFNWNHASMDAVLEEFQNFLRACGYVIEYNQCLVLENM